MVSTQFASAGEEGASVWLAQMEEDMARFQSDMKVTAQVIDDVFTDE